MMFNMKSIALAFPQHTNYGGIHFINVFYQVTDKRRAITSPLGCANVFTCARDLYDLSKHFQVAVVLSSFQLHNSKRLLVDLL